MGNGKTVARKYVNIGILFIIIAIVIMAVDLHKVMSYSHIDSVVQIKRGYKNRKEVNVTYEFDGISYEHVGLGSYNAFTMKNGKNLKIYVNPDRPEYPTTLSVEWYFIFGILGIAFVWFGKKAEKRPRVLI